MDMGIDNLLQKSRRENKMKKNRRIKDEREDRDFPRIRRKSKKRWSFKDQQW